MGRSSLTDSGDSKILLAKNVVNNDTRLGVDTTNDPPSGGTSYHPLFRYAYRNAASDPPQWTDNFAGTLDLGTIVAIRARVIIDANISHTPKFIEPRPPCVFATRAAARRKTMHRYTSQKGAALIMMMGIMASLAILAATMVFVIVNQQKATAIVRSRTQSVYAAEAALDSGVQLAKVASPMPTSAAAATANPWLDQAALALAFNGGFPGRAVGEFGYYDNITPVDTSTKWDSNADKLMWVQATVTYAKKTTKERVLVSQSIQPFSAALPKAVTYSDTGIRLKGTSDIYAVNADGSAGRPRRRRRPRSPPVGPGPRR